MGRLDEDGHLHVDGRRSDLIVTGGENVYPAEVEAVLHQIPGVADAGVVGLPDERWGERVVAVVVRKPGSALTAQEILKSCEGKLARFKLPRQIEFTDALPRNAQGKILKRVMRDQLRAVLAPSPSGRG